MSTIRVEVAYARPGRQWLIALTLPAGATLLDAVLQSGLPDQIPDLPALAGNVGIGRNFAGVHWRSDYRESLLLGEKIAIGTLMDYVGVFNEPNVQFQFNSFTGHPVIVTNHQVNVAGIDRIQQTASFSDELAVLDT